MGLKRATTHRPFIPQIDGLDCRRSTSRRRSAYGNSDSKRDNRYACTVRATIRIRLTGCFPLSPKSGMNLFVNLFPLMTRNLTHLRGMGKIAECFHRHPETIRSPHPAHSFMAWGQHADDWMSEHPLEDSFGHEFSTRKNVECGCENCYDWCQL